MWNALFPIDPADGQKPARVRALFGGVHGTLAYHNSIARIARDRTYAPAPAIRRFVMRLHASKGCEPKGLEGGSVAS